MLRSIYIQFNSGLNLKWMNKDYYSKVSVHSFKWGLLLVSGLHNQKTVYLRAENMNLKERSPMWPAFLNA